MNTNLLLNNRDLKEYFNMFSLCIYWKLSFFLIFFHLFFNKNLYMFLILI